MLSAISTPAYIYPDYRLFWAYETKHWSLKSNLNLIQKCHKLTHISFIKINMKHDPEWNPD